MADTSSMPANRTQTFTDPSTGVTWLVEALASGEVEFYDFDKSHEDFGPRGLLMSRLASTQVPTGDALALCREDEPGLTTVIGAETMDRINRWLAPLRSL